MTHPDAQKVLNFWFSELSQKEWFVRSDAVDKKIREQFLETHEDVVAGKTADWRSTPEGRLVEVIVLDQFSRNLFRDSAESFAYDVQALDLARAAIAAGDDKKVDQGKRAFFYLPFMHSESQETHEEALKLFTELGSPGNLKYEKLHKRIIDRFGRYPHRNAVLGRETTPEEQKFLDEDANAKF